MKRRKPWIKLPSGWIEENGLRQFRWKQGKGANNLAALMALTALAHEADEIEGTLHATYDELCLATGLSRAKLSAGLGVLEERGRIERGGDGRGSFRMSDYDPAGGWVMFPCSSLYEGDEIRAFHQMHLRNQAELNALKLYFLIASRRDRKMNWTMLTYDKIEEYSGVARNSIRQALSWLVLQNLIHIDRAKTELNEDGIANVYRLANLEPRRHAGTTGRADATAYTRTV